MRRLLITLPRWLQGLLHQLQRSLRCLSGYCCHTCLCVRTVSGENCGAQSVQILGSEIKFPTPTAGTCCDLWVFLYCTVLPLYQYDTFGKRKKVVLLRYYRGAVFSLIGQILQNCRIIEGIQKHKQHELRNIYILGRWLWFWTNLTFICKSYL